MSADLSVAGPAGDAELGVEKAIITPGSDGWRFEGVGDPAGLINSGRVNSGGSGFGDRAALYGGRVTERTIVSTRDGAKNKPGAKRKVS